MKENRTAVGLSLYNPSRFSPHTTINARQQFDDSIRTTMPFDDSIRTTISLIRAVYKVFENRFEHLTSRENKLYSIHSSNGFVDLVTYTGV